MYKMIRKQTRTDTSIPFFRMHESDDIGVDLKSHFAEEYVLPGKFLTVIEDLSTDQLELSITTFWNTKEDLDAFKADPICQQMRQIAEDHCTAHSIVVETVSEEEITL